MMTFDQDRKREWTLGDTSSGKVLVVDDDEANLKALESSLQAQGHAATGVGDGESALTLLRSDSFDLVLLDVMMSGIDGIEMLRILKEDGALRDIPVIMISALEETDSVIRCIASGAEDFLCKPVNPTLLRARIGASLEKKFLRDQDKAYLSVMENVQQRLTTELDEAVHYLRSLLPEFEEAPIRVDWEYIASTELGGDAFGYHWIDETHFAVYLIDVCGHGVGASLLAASVINMLRSQSHANTDVRQPREVLAALNAAFPMEGQNDMYFTAWYGVYETTDRRLKYASGGHPPALLLGTGAPGGSKQLRTPSPGLGIFSDREFTQEEVEIAPGEVLLVFCDGVYELTRADGSLVDLEDFEREAVVVAAEEDGLDRLKAWASKENRYRPFDDDYSIIRLRF